ncbi:hypothetical protein LTR10_011161 [Elasticomyces elasticus]|nr:hypothetical protein LTR10_011161 [Elasticomyces elasticus]
MMSHWLKATFGCLRRTQATSQKTGHCATPVPRDDTAASYSEGSGRYYIAKPEQRFHDGQYRALRQIGKGLYSHVWLAQDLHNDIYVALKLLTNDCYGVGHDIFELEILKTITEKQADLDRAGDAHLVGLLDHFQVTGPAGMHQCVVMPVLGCDIKAQAQRFAKERIPVPIMKEITRQLLKGLAFMHSKCRVIHTDIAAGQSVEAATPTLSEGTPFAVKIIDFGVGMSDLGIDGKRSDMLINTTASWKNKRLTDHIQPIHLRAPEVFLGAPWGTAVDIWSLGCLVIELTAGHIAFPGSACEDGFWTSEDDHLAQHMEILGRMPPELLKRGLRTSEYFDEQGNLLRIPTLHPTSLRAIIDGSDDPMWRPREMDDAEVAVFVDFLQGALTLDPEHRKTAKELLRHEWLQ